MAELDDSNVNDDNYLESSDDEMSTTPFSWARSRFEGVALFLNLDQFDKVPVLRTIADRFWIRPRTVVMLILTMGISSFLLYLGGEALFTIYAYVLPAYYAFKAQENRGRRNRNKLIRHWVRYFICLSFLTTLAPVLKFLIPYYRVLNMLVIVWL